MSDIKYEAVFGDMAQFNGMMPDCVLISGEYGYKIVEDTLYYCERYNERCGWAKSCVALEDFKPVAMRRIILQPKRWTIGDLLPEVGAEAQYKSSNEIGIIKAVNGGQLCVLVDDELVISYVADMKPIETPAEKAKRLREEWKNNVIEIHHGKRRKMSTSTFLLDDIYDALLSGELAAPKGGE